MATGAAVAVVGGTALQAYGQYKASRARERAARAQAEAKKQQAFEILDRFEVNAGLLRRRGEQVKARQVLATVASGVEISDTTTLVALEDTNRKISEQIAFERREAEFKAEQLFRGADIDTQLAGDIRKARPFELAGTFLQGARAFA